MTMLGRSALCGGGRCGGGEVSSALTDAAFASLETLKDECAALAAEVREVLGFSMEAFFSNVSFRHSGTIYRHFVAHCR